MTGLMSEMALNIIVRNHKGKAIAGLMLTMCKPDSNLNKEEHIAQ